MSTARPPCGAGYTFVMTRSQVHVPESRLPRHELRFLHELRDHETFFRELADAKLRA